MFSLAKRAVLVVLLLLAAGVIYVGFDLFGPVRSSLRDFDADAVARLETAMWRSYYDKQPAKLYLEMGSLLRSQYHLPPLRAQLAAYDAARAAFVFKRGHGRKDYERALPSLVRYYTRIRAVSREPFDIFRAADLELEWWIVHRERRSAAPGQLELSLAELQAELYGQAPEDFAEHAQLRALAMTIRDDQAEAGGVTANDWSRIEKLLRDSWRSLHRAVNSGGA